MLQRHFIYLFVLVVGILAEQSESNVQNKQRNTNDKLVNRQRREDDEDNSQSVDNVKSFVKSTTKYRITPAAPRRPVVPDKKPNDSQSSVISLVDSLECKSDIERYCIKGGSKMVSNLKVLQCINDLDNAVNLINTVCQNLIYKFKYSMTHDVRFEKAAMKQCAKDIKLLDDCNEHTEERGTGRLVSCLYEALRNVTEPGCRSFINQIQVIIFTDWRLSEYFAEACMDDITKFKCGRLDVENETLQHEQGGVVSCLTKRHNMLSKLCQKEILHLAEMQSDDYHLDRALFYACRGDRERLCPNILSGNGRIYRCLYNQKFNTMLSVNCREEVHKRQKIVVSNALVDVPLIRACNVEMTEHKCVVNTQGTDKQLPLINLLLCLEDKIKKGEDVKDECRREMLIHRRMLMSDYALSPEILSKCTTEMIQHCPSLYRQGASGSVAQRGGKMIHCLLGAARNEKNFSSECLSSIKSLVRAVDPGSDIRADPLLETACRPVIDTLCARSKAGDSNIVLCLLSNLKHSRMTEECEDRLMEVAYFMERDWKLTPRLLSSCQKSLIKFCNLPEDWALNKEMDDTQVGMYFGCLYQQRQKLDTQCRGDLKRLMYIRSQSIGLMPEIESNCIIDLGTCKNPEIKGEEMKCLQQKYDKLEEQCKAAVRNFTRTTIADPTLDFLLMKACEPMIELFCANVQGGNENDLLRCLIKNKNNQKMDFRCKAGIEHHQIISLKDTAFLSKEFETKCTKEISEHCPTKKTKSAVIQCLADLIIKDVLKKQNTINEECRNELKFELLQRGESITFDPSLAKACENDIRKFCGDRTPGNAQILDCLKSNHNKVSPTCYAKLQKREKIDVILPGNDYSLTSKCSTVIQKYCSNENRQNILLCLRRNVNQDSMPNVCRRVLYHRLMVLNSDARFNKVLIESCGNDIEKRCKGEVVDTDEDGDQSDEDKENAITAEVTDRDMGGRIIGCLRSVYADSNVELEAKCVIELVDVIQASKLDVQLDVKLYQKCKRILSSKCLGSDQEDCLKLLYQKNKLDDNDCKEQVIRIIKEGRADIHVDRVLAFACQTDLVKFCNDIPIGSGRQLQCLLSKSKSVTNQCKSVLLKRQELWSGISDVESVADLTRHIVYSKNNTYLTAIIVLILCVIFIAGCICRPCIRRRRVSKYN